MKKNVFFALKTFIVRAHSRDMQFAARRNQAQSPLPHAERKGESRSVPEREHQERQIHHTLGLAHCRCLSRNSKSVTRNVMIPLSAAALAYARQPGFSALIFSDVKPPTGQSAAYKQSAADDLQQMGLAVLTEKSFLASLLVAARNAPRWRSSRNTPTGLVAGSGRY